MDHMYEHLTVNVKVHILEHTKMCNTHVHIHSGKVYRYTCLHVTCNTHTCVNTSVWRPMSALSRLGLFYIKRNWQWKNMRPRLGFRPWLTAPSDLNRSDLSLQLSSVLSAFNILHMRISLYLGYCRSLKRFTEEIAEAEGGKQRWGK